MSTLTYSILVPADICEEIREPSDCVFALGLKEAERRGLGRAGSVLKSTSTFKGGVDFLFETEDLLINPGL